LTGTIWAAVSSFRPSGFLLSGRSADPGFFELEFSEAVAGGLTFPANSSLSDVLKLTAIAKRLRL